MRKTARENAMKFLFERIVNGNPNPITYDALSEGLSEDSKVFYHNTVTQTGDRFSFLKRAVARFVTTYNVERIYKLDLAILMIATNEILFMPDVPEKVSVNEAVEMAKTYSTDNSPVFINGVLASVINNKEELINEYDSENN